MILNINKQEKYINNKKRNWNLMYSDEFSTLSTKTNFNMHN